jgi:alanine racemase
MKADLETADRKRCYALIDLDALLKNLEILRECIPGSQKIIAVIKANAYGHGSVPIASVLEKEDSVWGYGVANAGEALILREAGIKKPLLVLGYTFPETYEQLAKQEIRPAVFRQDQIPELSKAALSVGKKIKVHVKIDTGMNRIGIRPDEDGLAFLSKLQQAKGVEIEGAFTHFHRADELEKGYTNTQLQAFQNFLQEAKKQLGLVFNIRHCANSAGILRMFGTDMDAVRAGICLYGLYPSQETGLFLQKLNPVLSLHSQIIYCKQISPGQEVSYGGTFVADHPMRIATIPLGYGDGYPRTLSSKGYVLIDGQKAPILGRICMDQFMVDVTHIPQASEGSPVTLLGTDGQENLSAWELSQLSGRFHYELLCCLADRIPRVYRLHGEEMKSPN